MATPTRDDGVIKYAGEHRDGLVPPSPVLDELNRARTTLFDLGLIGVYPDGIGFGNVSIRSNGPLFLITGSGTGADRTLHPGQYCAVEWFSIENNCVRSVGAVRPSSEAMTHGVIYALGPEIQCVMHVHCRALFDYHLSRGLLSTPVDVAYGTPAMARSVALIAQQQSTLPILFAMAGHDEGIVAFGTDVASVLALLIETYRMTISP